MIPILDPARRWECPSCRRQLKTDKPVTTFPLHTCKAQRGLTVPFVEVHGVEFDPRSTRHVIVERDDYVGREIVQTDGEGRPITAIVTERRDGSNDCRALASCAGMLAS